MSETRYGAPPKCNGIHTNITSKGRVITACYSGGAYIQLTFGSTGCNPSEVINVWDYEKGEAVIPGSVRDEVMEWIESNEEDGWADWYEDYITNARY